MENGSRTSFSSARSGYALIRLTVELLPCGTFLERAAWSTDEESKERMTGPSRRYAQISLRRVGMIALHYRVDWIKRLYK
jgi:hypothetical protein